MKNARIRVESLHQDPVLAAPQTSRSREAPSSIPASVSDGSRLDVRGSPIPDAVVMGQGLGPGRHFTGSGLRFRVESSRTAQDRSGLPTPSTRLYQEV